MSDRSLVPTGSPFMYVYLRFASRGSSVRIYATYTLFSTANPPHFKTSRHPKIQCYFLLSAKVSQPIIYLVDRVREGKTYATRAVKAVQHGNIIFIMLCSFQIPEPAPHRHQWPFPSDVPAPEACETAVQRFQRLSKLPGMTGKILEFAKVQLNVRPRHSIHGYRPCTSHGVISRTTHRTD